MAHKKSKAKISFVYDMAYPYHIGGVEVRNYGLAKRLGQKGFETHMLCVKLWSGKDSTVFDGIKYYGVCSYATQKFRGKRSFWEPLKYALSLYPALKTAGPDLIDASAFPYLHLLPCALYSKMHGVPLVITWHMYWGDWWIKYKGFLAGSAGLLVERLSRHLSKNNICVSETVRGLAGISDAYVVPNGVDLDLVKKIPPSKKKSDIIYVGRLIDGKNVDLIIKALSQMRKKAHLVIVGDGPKRQYLEELAKQWKLTGYVEFTGALNQEEALSHMKSSKIMVHPSSIEGFGIACVEAMACGLPVVTVDSENNASNKLIRDGVDGVVTKPREECLASAMDALLSDKTKLKKMSHNAVNKASKYCLGIQAENISEIYTRLIAD
ncbi:MAG: glycosyltransferase family 4 protein [Candidatus Altiarchaeota archaeon]|nr:glycosyltransferase family 4 protein [Candidatus Altiarchaeota archaeon]